MPLTRHFVGVIALVLCAARPSFADEKEECIAAADQGQTLRDQSKLFKAREQFARCVRDTCPGALRKDCAQFLQLVDDALPGVVITAKDGAGHEISSVKVTEGGTVLAEKLDGRALSLDPGEHVFHFTSAGKAAFDKTMIVKQGDKSQALVVQFAADAEPIAAAPLQNRPIETPPASGGMGTQKILGLVVGIAGLTGIGVGSIFGAVASSSWSDATTKCGAACGPKDPAQQSLASARSSAAVSTTFFIVGPALVAAGVVLFLTAPKASVSAALSPTPTGVLVSGRF